MALGPLSEHLMQFDRPFIAHIVHSLTIGGTERTLVALLRSFHPDTLRHVVVTLRDAGPLAAELPDHVACRALGARGRDRWTALRLARWVRASRPTILHARNSGCWNDATLSAAMLPSCQLVLGFHGLESGQTWERRHRRLANRGMLIGARFTCVSESGRQQLMDQCRIPPNRIEVLGNGVDGVHFRPFESARCHRSRNRLGIPEQAFVVGTVGSLVPVKGHASLLRAAARLKPSVPSLYTLIVGDGPLLHPLRSEAKSLGLDNCTLFAGNSKDVLEELAAMDVYVCSSVSESLSNALLEALACGVPAVVTDVGDHARVVRDGVEGYVVPVGDDRALTTALGRLAEDDALRSRFAQGARGRALDYDFRESSARYQRYYESLRPVIRSACRSMLAPV